MIISKNIQFNGAIIILYLSLWMVVSVVFKIIENPNLFYLVMYVVCFNMIYLPRNFTKRCKEKFGVQYNDPALFWRQEQPREILIQKTSLGKSFDERLPDPWRLFKVWDQVGGVIFLFKSTMVYFAIVAWIVEYTRNSGDWGYDWVGAYMSIFLIGFSIVIGGCEGILTWIRKPMVTIYQG